MTQLPEGLFALLDENHIGDLNLLEAIEQLLDADATPYIVRNTFVGMKEYENLIREIEELQDQMSFNFLVHTHFHLVNQTSAIGVHLNQRSSPISIVRKEIGPKKLIGYSAHSIEDALEAQHQGADYIFLGAIFDTPKDHPNHPILGIDVLKDACRKIDIPIYAIGGIDTTNLTLVRSAGAAGFSALRAVFENSDLEHNISKLGFVWEDF